MLYIFSSDSNICIARLLSKLNAISADVCIAQQQNTRSKKEDQKEKNVIREEQRNKYIHIHISTYTKIMFIFKLNTNKSEYGKPRDL